MSESSVRIRTYRHGLGDCFLLTFSDDTSPATNVLIDCGVLLGTTNAAATMQQVAGDIRSVTGNHVDVVIATHEHWDHVSGFNQARDIFEPMTFGQIWMAWTENPRDPLASRLREDRDNRRRALVASLGLWRQSSSGGAPFAASEQRRVDEATGLLEFFGPTEPAGLAADSRPSAQTTADAMAYLRSKGPTPQFLSPGTVIEMPGLPAVRAFVLGPPRNERWLKKERPSTRTPETYHVGTGSLSLADSFFGAVARHRHRSDPTEPDQPPDEVAFPFDRSHHLDENSSTLVSAHQWFERHYRTGPEWRQIDREWLGSTSELALKLDSDTNNTSLVLAFEIGRGGPVLLFPGDAQVGNWLSWQDVTWDDEPDVTVDDLLSRTVFYKVAHHGSHNATLEELGLEKMTGDSLMAMVPVDRDTATKRKWSMPFEPLWTRLNERCDGRVFRSDEDAASHQAFGPAGTEIELGEGLLVAVSDEPFGRAVDLTLRVATPDDPGR